MAKPAMVRLSFVKNNLDKKKSSITMSKPKFRPNELMFLNATRSFHIIFALATYTVASVFLLPAATLKILRS